MPDFRLQVLGRDSRRQEADSSLERARRLWNNSYQRSTDTGKRVEAMIAQSEAMRETDPDAAAELARKAELLSKELSPKMQRSDVDKSMQDQMKHGGAKDAMMGPLAQGAMATSGAAPWWVKLAQAADTLKPERTEDEYGEVQEGTVPWRKKVQRKAIQTLHKFPTRESYVSHEALGGDYDEVTKRFGKDFPYEGITARPENFETGYTNLVDYPHNSYNTLAYYQEGKPVGGIKFDPDGKVSLAGVSDEHQGLGIGKDLYKLGATLGRNIFDTDLTSSAARHARYSAIRDLAKGDIPKRPRSFDREQLEPVPVPNKWASEATLDWSEMSAGGRYRRQAQEEADKLERYMNLNFSFGK